MFRLTERSLFSFLLITVIGSITALFLINKAEMAINEIESLQSQPLFVARREFSRVDANVTIDWETYRNEKYGFEVKYRGDWSVRVSNEPLQFERVYITGPNGSYALIAPLGWPTGLPASLKIEKVESNIGGKHVSIERFLTQDGIEWGRYITFVDYPTSWNDLNFLFVQARFISIETVCVEVVCGPKSGTIDANEKEILESILSTFKFVN